MSRLNHFLSGVKVLDLSMYLPGPLASLMLSDMGAEVIKVEPLSGDGMTALGPKDPAGRPLFYETVNAGKSVLRLNLKEEAQREEFLRLVRDADILLEGFRPGVMARLGLDYHSLNAINPRLIYCSLSGYGATGPMSQVAAHDGNFLALSGTLHRNGDEAPIYFDPPVADSAATLFALAAVLAALHGRQHDGRGCEIDLAIADVVMPLQLFPIAALGTNGENPGFRETYLNGGAAYYRVYRTHDGKHVMLGAVEPKFWANFCHAAERPAWLDRQEEAIPQQSLSAELAAYFAGLDLDQCIEKFGDADCCFTPLLDLREAMESPHHRARGLVRRSPAGALQALFPVLVGNEAPDARAEMTVLAPGAGWSRSARKPSTLGAT